MLNFYCSENQDFLNYWTSLSREGVIPNRSNFFPEEIPKLLPFITIYELVSKDCIRFKLSGSNISKRDGFDRTGTNYLDEVVPARRARAAEAFWLLYDQPCGMRVVLNMRSKSGQIKVIEGLGLPMRNKEGGYPLLYYTNHQITEQVFENNAPEDRLDVITIQQRDFIDIGAGIPSFKD